jgi:quercetin dioxygenase-like cupin family protein
MAVSSRQARSFSPAMTMRGDTLRPFFVLRFSFFVKRTKDYQSITLRVQGICNQTFLSRYRYFPLISKIWQERILPACHSLIDKKAPELYFLTNRAGSPKLQPQFPDLSPRERGDAMKIFDLAEGKFSTDKFYRQLLFDSPNLRVLTFNFEPGQELPVHSHDVDSEVALLILEGEGVLTGSGENIPAQTGFLQIMPVSEPHGLRALTRLRLLVFIAPTL